MHVKSGIILRRILEPIFLGSLSNIIVNFIFNPQSFTFSLDEFAVAVILSIPLTELNWYIDRKLERKISWIERPQQRFGIHLLLISSGLLISLNVLGNTYMWITQQGFFSWKEIVVINLVTLCLAILLTVINWLFHFYFRWKSAEVNTQSAFRMVDDLRQKVVLGNQYIELQKGTSRIKVESKIICVARIEFGTVRVYSNKGVAGIFAGTLSQLYALLPGHLYFQVTRDTILHRDLIRTITSSTFGKIELTIDESIDAPTSYTVSRTRASAFRRWFNSNSARKE
jgi:hypothetical protein